MEHPPEVMAALKKAKVIDPQTGAIRVTKLLNPPPARSVPIIQPATLKRLLEADTTPDHRWTYWLLYEAAGGKEAVKTGEKVYLAARQRMLAALMHGVTRTLPNGEKKTYPPQSREAATKYLDDMEEKNRAEFFFGDEDFVQKGHAFYNEWPGGPNERYAKVTQALTEFLKIGDLLKKMNGQLVKEGSKPLPDSPDEIESVAEMNDITKKVHRYFAASKARTDIRVDMIYDDAEITALCPLTYAAAVKYGWDEWDWANKQGFETLLTSEHAFKDAWKSAANGGKYYVYLTFKGPVPAWVSRKNGTFQQFDLTDLALMVPKTGLSSVGAGDFDSVVVYDQENAAPRTVGQIKDMILAEPSRTEDTEEDEDESPIKRPRNVYKTDEEAQRVVAHLDKALAAISQWAKTFDPATIKGDTLRL